jgi:hypothetical protein
MMEILEGRTDAPPAVEPDFDAWPGVQLAASLVALVVLIGVLVVCFLAVLRGV